MYHNATVPRYSFISDLTNAQQCVATFSSPHNFIVGEIVSFRVTPAFGMSQINNLEGTIVAQDTYTITVDIDTSSFFPFTLANLNAKGTTPPVCVPSASGIPTGEYTPTVTLNDCFDNISTTWVSA